MSRLTKYAQKIFGSSAGTNQMSEFGSLAAGSPARYTGAAINPAIIQTLANYLQGWVGATVASNSPAIEDMNSLCYLFAYQLAYIIQWGVAEWDSATDYFSGSIAQSGGINYVSMIDNNVNGALSDSTKWFSPIQSSLRMRTSVPFTTGFSILINETVVLANAVIGTSQTVSVPNGANLISLSKLTVSGTGVIVASGTGTVRVI